MNKPNDALPNVRLYLCLILLAALVLRVVFSAGMSGNDDLSLANISLDMLDHGMRVPTGHYAARFGLILPLAGIFALFGVGVWQLILFPMVMSVLGVALAYSIGNRLFGPRVGLAGAMALAVYPMDVEFAGLFFPDLIQGVAMAGAIALLLAARDAQSGNRSGDWQAIAAGFAWGLAYYVKIDAFFLSFVVLLAAMMGLVTWRHLVIVAAVTGVLVGAELLTYGVLLGHPFHRIELEHTAANEVLANGMTYRDLTALPKAMFLTVYRTGFSFYLLVGALIAAAVGRQRPALFLAAWVLIFFTWLIGGVDPFSVPMTAKPQLVRYLLGFAVPMAVLIGWGLVRLYDRMSQPAAVLIGVAAIAFALPLMAFNGISYQAARASRDALARAERENLFPLYSDVQSANIISMLVRRTARAKDFHEVQFHDFLTGKTRFGSIDQSPAYLLINREYSDRLEQRSLVERLTPDRFGMRATALFAIDQSLPEIDYKMLRALAWASGFLPLASVRNGIQVTTANALKPAIVTVYRLER